MIGFPELEVTSRGHCSRYRTKSSSDVTKSQSDLNVSDFEVRFVDQNNGGTNALRHASIMSALATNEESKETIQIAEELAKEIFSESSYYPIGERDPFNTVRNNNTALKQIAKFQVKYCIMSKTKA